MSFYGYRASQMGAPIFENPRMSGFGKLPVLSMPTEGVSSTMRALVDTAKMITYPGASAPLDVLMRQAAQIEQDAGPFTAVALPGVTENGLAAKMASIDLNIKRVWDKLLMDAAYEARNIEGAVRARNLANPSDVAGNEILSQTLREELIRANAVKIGKEINSLFQQYVTEIPLEIAKVREAVEAKNAVVVTANKVEAAKAEVAAAGSKTEAFVATTKLDSAMKALAEANVKAYKTAKATATGRSLLIMGAVAVPVIGIIAYAALKKKKSSVAGYRRRRARR